jgi:WhiB family transcriptional regulator, redox-sensing transcriptional regulator
MPPDSEPAGNWRAAGACLRADPDLFFPISTAGRAVIQIAQAKAVCAHCPVRRQCLEFAQAHEPVYGIWGGTTFEERQRARRREQRAARARVCAADGWASASRAAARR